MVVNRLSKQAETIIYHAHECAEQRRHTTLDCPHLFWSLLNFSDPGRDWLSLRADECALLADLSAALDRWYESGDSAPEPTAAYILAMRAAQEQAGASSSAEISPGHLLKAVLETDSFLPAWLKEQGIESLAVGVAAPTPLLDEFGRDLTRLARRGDLPTVIGRDEEVRQLIEILLRHGKNSALLLGLPGVGKTAVVERLAQDIAGGKAPLKLAAARLVELNIGALVSGSSYRGQLEERLRSLLDEVRGSDDVIVVIDEFHTAVGAGSTSGGSMDVANLLKPALARGELTCIGITTFQEYARHVEGDAALARRFEKIVIAEPSEDETRAILAGLVPRYEKHHGLTVGAEALDVIVKLAAQYLPSRQFPDKAVDVLGIACSRAELQCAPQVSAELVAAIVSELAGVPVGQLTAGAQELLVNLETRLSSKVIGQAEAVSVLARSIRLAYTGLRDPRRPRGVFLFVGPSGVGKTQLARSLAEQLFGDERALLRLDMSEYAEKHTVSRLVGAPPGYVGYDEPGQLSQPLRDRPHAVVLLDEIEKAHPEVFDIFLSLFDEGRLTDTHGRPVDGRHAIFIMTSNLGTTHGQRAGVGFERRPELRDAALDDALRAFFRPEFLNRIDHIVRFRELDADDLAEVVALELRALKARMETQGLRLTYADSVLEAVAAESLRRGAGARGIKRVVEERIAVPLSDLLLAQGGGKHGWLHVEVERGVILPGWV